MDPESETLECFYFETGSGSVVNTFVSYVGVHPECEYISLFAVPAITWGNPSRDPHPIAPQSLAIGPANQWLESWCSGEWRERRGRDTDETENDYRGDGSVQRAPALALSLLVSVWRKSYGCSEAGVFTTSTEDRPVSLL